MPGFGTPFERVGSASLTSTMVVEPSLGLDVSKSPLNLGEGATPNASNYIMRDARLEPRSALSSIAHGLRDDIAGGIDAVNVADQRYLAVGIRPGTNSLAYRGSGDTAWTPVSYVSAYGVNDPPTAAADLYWDFTQIFHDQSSDNIAVGAVSNRNAGLYCWTPGATVFSTLTGSPGAAHPAGCRIRR